jgi:hypothetical protein
MGEMNYLTAHMAMPHGMTSFSQIWGQILKHQPGHCSVIHDGRLLNEHRWARLGRGSGRFATRTQTICHLRETQLHETIADQTSLLVIEWEQQIMGHRDELQYHGHWVIGQNLKYLQLKPCSFAQAVGIYKVSTAVSLVHSSSCRM